MLSIGNPVHATGLCSFRLFSAEYYEASLSVFSWRTTIGLLTNLRFSILVFQSPLIELSLRKELEEFNGRFGSSYLNFFDVTERFFVEEGRRSSFESSCSKLRFTFFVRLQSEGRAGYAEREAIAISFL